MRQAALRGELLDDRPAGRFDYLHGYTYPVQMTNLTLSIEDDVLRAARKLAAERETTVNAMVRKFLAEQVAQKQRIKDSLARMTEIAEEGGMEVGPITWTRDELYER
jgi:predicted transcriptional regulator